MPSPIRHSAEPQDASLAASARAPCAHAAALGCGCHPASTLVEARARRDETALREVLATARGHRPPGLPASAWRGPSSPRPRGLRPVLRGVPDELGAVTVASTIDTLLDIDRPWPCAAARRRPGGPQRVGSSGPQQRRRHIRAEHVTRPYGRQLR